MTDGDEPPPFVVLLGADGRIQGANAAFERATGRDLEQLRATPWVETLVPDTRRIEWSEERVQAGGASPPFVVLHGVERRPARRGRARSRRGSSEARLDEVQRLAKLGSWELDLATNHLTWSDEIFRIFEVDPARFEASYDGFLAVIHPEDRAAVDAAYAASVRDRTPYAIEHRLLMRDGRVKWVQERGQTTYARDGRPLRSVGTVQDVTDRVEAEAAARDSEVRFRVAFHENPIAMAIWRRGDDEILDANRAFLELLGRRNEELIGASAGALRLEVSSGDPDEVLARIRRRELLRNLEVRLAPATGNAREALLTASYLTVGGRDCALVGLVDVTERRAAEARVRTSLAEKEVLLREVHHRVRNNLQVISSLVFFQKKKLAIPEAGVVFDELRDRILAMALLHERIYQAADVARAELGGYLRALVAALGQSSVGRANARVVVEADDTRLPIEIALPIGMIVCELVTNVWKYAFPARADGKATVSAYSRGGRLLLAVEDDGVGFPPAFDPHARGSFGWELVKRLVAQLDGAFEVVNDRGAQVRVSVPLSAGIPLDG